MGTEILGLLLLFPLIIGFIDVIKIMLNKNRVKHVILLSASICLIFGMGLSDYIDGFHPMQGVVIGSLYYIPSYLVVYLLLTVISKKRKQTLNQA